MAHQHKTIPPKRTPRAGRKRRFGRPERSLATAGWLGALTVVAVAVVILLVELMIPNSTVRNFCEMVFINQQVSPQSDIYQTYIAEVDRQDDLFVFPTSLFIGGLIMGRLAPGRASRRRALGAAALVALAVILACLSMVWVPTLKASQGRLPEGFDRVYALTLVACVASWTATFVIGAFCGLLWRSARRRSDAGGPPPTPAEASAATH